MQRARILLGLGVWIAVLPYLGFPYFWKNILLSLAGIGVILLGLVVYREFKKERGDSYDNFSENKDFTEISN